MEMKKIMGIVLLISALAPVLAQEDLPDPGILPDSPFYGLKRGWEGFVEIVTFGPEAKAQLHYKYAETRLAEANAMVQRGKPEFAEDLVGQYETEMNRTQERLRESQGIGADVSDFVRAMNQTRERNLYVLELVAEKVPPQAATRIRETVERRLQQDFGNQTEAEQVRDRIQQQVRQEIQQMNQTSPADECENSQTRARMAYRDALAIAGESECGQIGQAKQTRICNSNSGTWWIDWDVRDDAWTDPGLKGMCNPACVVNVGTREAEINWRCTGALPPQEQGAGQQSGLGGQR
jgi:predicted RNA-binding Zn ribbon-like protein